MAVDTTGINTAKVAEMKNKIEAWAKAIDNANISVSGKKVKKALKGSNQEQAVASLCQACDAYANTLTAKLRAYKNRLDDVKTAYAKNDSSATAISNVTAAVNKLKS